MKKRKYVRDRERVILMKVDFAFKYVMHNQKVIKGFLAAILGIDKTEIKSIEYLDTNTEKSWENEKLGILDLLVLLNGNKKVNIEIQISYQKYWNNRLLFYACEEYVSGHRKGKGYKDKEVPSVISVSILDFVYFENNPYVYNHFGIYNTRTQERLTEKLDINIIELGKLENVLPEEEKEYSELVKWSRFISSTSWEEYEMYGKGDEAMEEAIKELRKINEIDMEYERYIRRELARRDAYQIKEDEREFKEEIAKNREEIAKSKEEIARNEKEIAKSKEEIAKGKEEIARNKEQLLEKDKEIERLKKELEKLKMKRK